MDGFVQFAQRLVKAVSNSSPFPISLSNVEGYIIGDSNAERIGTIHSPSTEVLKKNRALLYHQKDIAETENVLPGIALPLILENKTVGVLGIIGDPEEVEPYAFLVKKYVELMWQETFRKQVDDLETKALETFIQYILSNEIVTDEKIEQYCEMFHIKYHERRFCIVVDIGNSLLEKIKDGPQAIAIDELKDSLLNSTTTAFKSNADGICTFLNTEKIILLKPVTSDDVYLQLTEEFTNQCEQLITMLQNYGIADISIAAGSSYPTLKHINQSYLEANNLLKIGLSLHINPPIYHFNSWEMLLTLLPKQIGSDFREKLLFRLKPFIETDGFTDLAKNFITYCNHNMNVSKAAKVLFIHRNTLIYRLKKIETITSIDTGSFEHCILLYLILNDHVVDADNN